jgi:hypothetical protein
MKRPLRVLVACEFSGRVRDAFTALGADAMAAQWMSWIGERIAAVEAGGAGREAA